MTTTQLLLRPDDFGPSTTYDAWMLANSMSPKTRATRRRFLAAREDEWGTSWNIPAETLAAWLGAFEGWTQRTYHSHFVSIFNWRIAIGQAHVNPMDRIRRAPAPSKRPWPLSEFERRRAMEAATGDVGAYLMLGCLQGLRAGEIAAMHGQNITAQGVYVMGKGGQGDMLPTHPLIWELAQTYPREAYWFPSNVPHRAHIRSETVTANVGALFDRLNIRGSSHRNRHTYGTNLRRGGADTKLIQKLMRHRSLASTEFYLGVDDDELRVALERLSI